MGELYNQGGRICRNAARDSCRFYATGGEIFNGGAVHGDEVQRNSRIRAASIPKPVSKVLEATGTANAQLWVVCPNVRHAYSHSVFQRWRKPLRLLQRHQIAAIEDLEDAHENTIARPISTFCFFRSRKLQPQALLYQTIRCVL